MKTFGLSNKHDGLNWKALNMFRNVLHYDEHVQMLIFIGLAELDWKRTWGDNYVMIKRAWAGPTLNSWRKGVRPALLFFFCFTFLWVNHNLLSNSYQLLSVRACSTCSDFFLTLMLRFWSRLLKVYQPLWICFLGPQTPVWICFLMDCLHGTVPRQSNKFAQRPSALCRSVCSCVFVLVQICCLFTGHIHVYPYVSKKRVISATAWALHHCESVKQNWCSVQQNTWWRFDFFKQSYPTAIPD